MEIYTPEFMRDVVAGLEMPLSDAAFAREVADAVGMTPSPPRQFEATDLGTFLERALQHRDAQIERAFHAAGAIEVGTLTDQDRDRVAARVLDEMQAETSSEPSAGDARIARLLVEAWARAHGVVTAVTPVEALPWTALRSAFGSAWVVGRTRRGVMAGMFIDDDGRHAAILATQRRRSAAHDRLCAAEKRFRGLMSADAGSSQALIDEAAAHDDHARGKEVEAIGIEDELAMSSGRAVTLAGDDSDTYDTLLRVAIADRALADEIEGLLVP